MVWFDWNALDIVFSLLPLAVSAYEKRKDKRDSSASLYGAMDDITTVTLSLEEAGVGCNDILPSTSTSSLMKQQKLSISDEDSPFDNQMNPTSRTLSVDDNADGPLEGFCGGVSDSHILANVTTAATIKRYKIERKNSQQSCAKMVRTGRIQEFGFE